MDRPIVGFKLDEAHDWTAILSCGHLQHTRHRPPFENRNWVLTEEGRNSKLGQILNCVRCDDFEIPADFVMFKNTPEFMAETVPEALKHNHRTAPGVWGKIIVLEGRLLYWITSKNTFTEIAQGRPAIIVPELVHRVETKEPVRFFIEFYKKK